MRENDMHLQNSLRLLKQICMHEYTNTEMRRYSKNVTMPTLQLLVLLLLCSYSLARDDHVPRENISGIPTEIKTYLQKTTSFEIVKKLALQAQFFDISVAYYLNLIVRHPLDPDYQTCKFVVMTLDLLPSPYLVFQECQQLDEPYN